jgi:hypothetical protein
VIQREPPSCPIHSPATMTAPWTPAPGLYASAGALSTLTAIRSRQTAVGQSRTVSRALFRDYVVWGRGVDHSWFVEEEAVVLTGSSTTA